MWAHERQARILDCLGRDGKVQTSTLAGIFDVSRETIRRDLMELEGRGGLLRVHGGALQATDNVGPEPTFADRLEQHADVKHAIGQKACELIPPGSTVFIDTGTTTLAFARSLSRIGDIRIITNSIEIARLTGPLNSCETLLLGGRPHREVPATYGELTLSEIDRFLSDFAIIAPVALHMTRGAANYELHEAEVARKMMLRAESCIMLCHAEKLGKESRVSICQPDEIAHLVTDRSISPDFQLSRGTIHLAAV